MIIRFVDDPFFRSGQDLPTHKTLELRRAMAVGKSVGEESRVLHTKLVDWSQAASVPTKIRESAVTTRTFSAGLKHVSKRGAETADCAEETRTVQVSS